MAGVEGLQDIDAFAAAGKLDKAWQFLLPLVARKTMPYTTPVLISFDESFDVGIDTRYGVDDNDYQPPFRFTGKLDKLTITLGPTDEMALQQKAQEAKNKGQ